MGTAPCTSAWVAPWTASGPLRALAMTRISKADEMGGVHQERGAGRRGSELHGSRSFGFALDDEGEARVAKVLINWVKVARPGRFELPTS